MPDARSLLLAKTAAAARPLPLPPTGQETAAAPTRRREGYAVSALVIGFGLSIIAMVWILVFFKAAAEREVEIAAIVKENNNLARVFEEHIVRTIKSVDQVLLLLKYQYEKNGRNMELERYVSEGMIAADFYNQLGVIDEHGDYILSSLPSFKPINLAFREHFQVHVAKDSHELFISKPFFGKVTNKWSLALTRRVNKPDGSFGGVVVVAVDPFYFSSFYQQVDLGTEGRVSLVGRDGTIRARHSHSQAGVGQSLLGTELFRNLELAPSGTFESTSVVDQVRRISSYRSLEHYPLVVVVGRSEDETLAAFEERRRGYIIGAALVTLILTAVSAVLVVMIARVHRSAADLRASQVKVDADVALQRINHKLHDTENQLLQSEKMASIGQLAAGVAHEINNPIAYVDSNLRTMEKYIKVLVETVEALESVAASIDDPGVRARLQVVRESVDLPFLKEDVVALIDESKEGISRVTKIVLDLKDFSRVDSTDDWQFADLHAGIESTLNIVGNEIKYKAQVVREYSVLPQVECLPSQLNQVFMNMLINAAQAIEGHGTIVIRTGLVADAEVWVEFADDGAGIAPEDLKRIFDPFFTTKPVGKGTGLGLSLSHGILAKHEGRIDVRSERGKGTTFRITLPVLRSRETAASDACLAQAA